MSGVFCDGIRSVSLRNGVVRIELTQTASDGVPYLSGTILLPEGQAHAFLETLERRFDDLMGARSTEDIAAGGDAGPVEKVDEDIGDLSS